VDREGNGWDKWQGWKAQINDWLESAAEGTNKRNRPRLMRAEPVGYEKAGRSVVINIRDGLAYRILIQGGMFRSILSEVPYSEESEDVLEELLCS
jgi:hypothetical protein